mmetsp:Transcript_1732/g.5306  ORF Transcript_1732/g.5306 Transcript_1732/m.5306 type:complete len:281 (+) Transcript_1732:633-1475(+)
MVGSSLSLTARSSNTTPRSRQCRSSSTFSTPATRTSLRTSTACPRCTCSPLSPCPPTLCTSSNSSGRTTKRPGGFTWLCGCCWSRSSSSSPRWHASSATFSCTNRTGLAYSSSTCSRKCLKASLRRSSPSCSFASPRAGPWLRPPLTRTAATAWPQCSTTRASCCVGRTLPSSSSFFSSLCRCSCRSPTRTLTTTSANSTITRARLAGSWWRSAPCLVLPSSFRCMSRSNLSVFAAASSFLSCRASCCSAGSGSSASRSSCSWLVSSRTTCATASLPPAS